MNDLKLMGRGYARCVTISQMVQAAAGHMSAAVTIETVPDDRKAMRPGGLRNHDSIEWLSALPIEV